jgi:hypothetical protein
MNRKKILIYSIVIIVMIIFSTCLVPANFIERPSKSGSNEFTIPKKVQSSAMVYINKYDTNNDAFTQEPLRSLTIDEAYQLKQELLKIEDEYDTSLEKIEMQIQTFKDWSILPVDFSIEPKVNRLTSMKERLPIFNQSNGVVPNVIVCGPAVTSFLTIGGPIIPLHVLLFNLLPPFWYNTTNLEFDAFNGTRMVGFLGILPMTAFYCTATTLINAYGLVIGENTVISPFISLSVMDVLMGLSIAIFDDGFPINIFDWILGFSLTGLVAYVDIA